MARPMTSRRCRDISDRVERKAVARIDLHHEPANVDRRKGLLRAQRLIEDDAETVDIDALVDVGLSGQHLGRHVGRSPADLPCGGESVETEDLRRTKVDEARA